MGENLEWFLRDQEGERILGNGDEVTIKPLPVGNHTIRLVVTDKAGNTGNDEILIVIGQE